MPNPKEVCSELGAAAGMQGSPEPEQVLQWFQGRRTIPDAQVPLPSLRLSTGSGTGIPVVRGKRRDWCRLFWGVFKALPRLGR